MWCVHLINGAINSRWERGTLFFSCTAVTLAAYTNVFPLRSDTSTWGEKVDNCIIKLCPVKGAKRTIGETHESVSLTRGHLQASLSPVKVCSRFLCIRKTSWSSPHTQSTPPTRENSSRSQSVASSSSSCLLLRSEWLNIVSLQSTVTLSLSLFLWLLRYLCETCLYSPSCFYYSHQWAHKRTVRLNKNVLLLPCHLDTRVNAHLSPFSSSRCW